MSITLGMLAWTLLGIAPAAPTPSQGGAPTQIGYAFRFVEMPGVDWRGEVHGQLQTVVRKDGATVWTAPRAAAETIVKRGTSLAFPKVTTYAGQVAHVTNRFNRNFVADMEPKGDDTVSLASTRGFTPTIASAREGLAATISGRALDQGVLARLVLEDSHVARMHTYAVSASGRSSERGSTGSTNSPRATIQVPEFRQGEVAGEWLIPSGGILLVSLGVETVADQEGKALTRERLVLIEAKPMPSDPARVATRDLAPTRRVDDEEEAPSRIPMPLPPSPSRTLPHPLDADGQPLPLPPLPKDPTPPTTLPGSSDPCPTPQTGVKSSTPTRREPLPEGKSTPTTETKDASSRAVFQVEPPECADGGGCCKSLETRSVDVAHVAESASSTASTTTHRNMRLRLPFGATVDIEIRATAGENAPPPASTSPARRPGWAPAESSTRTDRAGHSSER